LCLSALFRSDTWWTHEPIYLIFCLFSV